MRGELTVDHREQRWRLGPDLLSIVSLMPLENLTQSNISLRRNVPTNHARRTVSLDM